MEWYSSSLNANNPCSLISAAHEDDLQRALENSPDDPRVHLLNAMRHWKVGRDLKSADSAFNKAITMARRQKVSIGI